MEAEDRLAAQVAGKGRVLTIGFGPAALAGRDGEAFQTDLRTHEACLAAGVTSRFGPWLPPAAEPYDEIVLRMPRAGDRLRMSLAMVRACVRVGGAVTVVGHNDSGVRAAPRDLRALVGETEVAATRWHCRAVRARVGGPYEPAHLEDFASTWMLGEIEVHSYPGVFAHGRLDPGTALLLRALSDEPMEGRRVLDLACGAGVIAAWAGARGARCDAVDTDAVAVEAAARTGAPYGVRASASDLYSAVDAPYELVLTNPPFHREGRVSLEIARRVIEGAPAVLGPRGELWMVVNRFLDHSRALGEAFSAFEIAAEDRRYRVWRARR